MSTKSRFGQFATASFLTAVFLNHSALAITAEVAKSCEILTAKAFPPRILGNPAAGSAKGDALAQRAYFNKCVANGGKVDDDTSKDTPKPPPK